jgi:excisionase family DNA binding protein
MTISELNAKEDAALVDLETMTVEEVATELKVRNETIYKYRKSGRLKGVRIGRRWRFSRENIRKFLNGE